MSWAGAGCGVIAVMWALTVAGPFRLARSDFTQDYVSSRALRDGQSIYAPLPISWAQPGAAGEVVNDHPPPYVVALTPLSPHPSTRCDRSPGPQRSSA